MMLRISAGAKREIDKRERERESAREKPRMLGGEGICVKSYISDMLSDQFLQFLFIFGFVFLF